MGAKVDIVDDGGTLAVKGWRDRGVAGEARTGTRLLEVKERALVGKISSASVSLSSYAARPRTGRI